MINYYNNANLENIIVLKAAKFKSQINGLDNIIVKVNYLKE